MITQLDCKNTNLKDANDTGSVLMLYIFNEISFVLVKSFPRVVKQNFMLGRIMLVFAELCFLMLFVNVVYKIIKAWALAYQGLSKKIKKI